MNMVIDLDELVDNLKKRHHLINQNPTINKDRAIFHAPRILHSHTSQIR